MKLAEKIKNLKVPKNKLAIFWLGNASFALKSEQNDIIYIDPYLSDCAERNWGLKRLYPSLIMPKELEADYILVTHKHEDHFDIDSIPQIMQQNDILLMAPEQCINSSNKMGIEKNKLILTTEGDLKKFDNFKVETVFADHGDLAPGAVGYILDFDGLKVYFTGDTAYSPEKMQKAFSQEPQILVAPINGEFNNLNPIEAGAVARDCKANVVIPSHFWMFAEHNGDLKMFVESLKVIAPRSNYELITQGSYYLHEK